VRNRLLVAIIITIPIIATGAISHAQSNVNVSVSACSSYPDCADYSNTYFMPIDSPLVIARTACQPTSPVGYIQKVYYETADMAGYKIYWDVGDNLGPPPGADNALTPIQAADNGIPLCLMVHGYVAPVTTKSWGTRHTVELQTGRTDFSYYQLSNDDNRPFLVATQTDWCAPTYYAGYLAYTVEPTSNGGEVHVYSLTFVSPGGPLPPGAGAPICAILYRHRIIPRVSASVFGVYP